MKYFFSWLVFLVCVHVCKAQDNYLNTKTPYHPQQTNYTPEPKGFKPVFINYTGRHGARFQTSADKDQLVIAVLKQADQQHQLTTEGAVLLAQLQLFQQIEQNSYGELTLLGKEEQEHIAARMSTAYPGVITNGKLLLETTDKLRTQQSAKAFLKGLPYYDAAGSTSIIFPAASDSILRFYDLSEAYKTYEKSAQIKIHIDSLLNDERTATASFDICKTIFTKEFIQHFSDGSIKDDKQQSISSTTFSLALYDIYCSTFATSEELKTANNTIHTTLNKVFNNRILQWFDTITSASDFYEKGPAEDASGIQATIAIPLLYDLLKTTDTAINQKKYDAVLRFTHAEAISPLAALMEISQASTTSSSVFDFYKGWKAADIIPMSANIQWILYSNGKTYLLKILLNEKEIALPVATKTYPYYNWNDVKTYYLNKIASLRKN